MTPEQRDHIEKLWEFQRAARERLQAMADYMGKMGANNILPQDGWDQLNRAWDDANKDLGKIGEALLKLHDLKP